MVTGQPDVALGILTADCAPVLLWSRHQYYWQRVAGRCIIWCYRKHDLSDAKLGPCEKYRLRGDASPRIPLSRTGNSAQVNQTPRVLSAEPEKRKINSIFAGTFVAACNSGVTIRGAVKMDTYAREDLFFSYRRACHREDYDAAYPQSCWGLTRSASHDHVLDGPSTWLLVSCFV